MKRRDLLKAAPAGIFAASLPAAGRASSAEETPVMALYRQWQALGAHVNGPVGYAMSEPEFDLAVDELFDLEVKLVRTPSENARDFIVKVIVFTGAGALGLPDSDVAPDLWDEARALISGRVNSLDGQNGIT